LEVKVFFKMKTVFIIWFGTHAKYDKRNKRR
jgi:mRNA-degrading endonuclease HigB of HigAB toxin-antitoxin module